MIDYEDLQIARDVVIHRSKRKYPGVRALDTLTPQIKSGLLVVQFDPTDTLRFCDDIARANMERLAAAKKEYGVALFKCAIASGIVYGAQAERDR